jgi:hypothetical protein
MLARSGGGRQVVVAALEALQVRGWPLARWLLHTYIGSRGTATCHVHCFDSLLVSLVGLAEASDGLAADSAAASCQVE